MSMKSKIERIKAIVSHVLHESSCLLGIVNNTSGYSQMFQLVINHEHPCGSKKERSIILGLENLSCLYELCHSFCKKYDVTFESNHYEFANHVIDDLSIDTFELKEEELNKTDFLREEEFSSVDLLVIYALASSLYHEFGHVKYDEGPRSISNERKADEFAFKIVHDKCILKNIEKSPEFLGLLLDYILILHLLQPYDKRDNTHPHPIERLCTLLEHFAISDDSYIWGFIYCNVYEWANKNIISIPKMNCYSGKEGLKNILSIIKDKNATPTT